MYQVLLMPALRLCPTLFLRLGAECHTSHRAVPSRVAAKKCTRYFISSALHEGLSSAR